MVKPKPKKSRAKVPFAYGVTLTYGLKLMFPLGPKVIVGFGVLKVLPPVTSVQFVI